jgi:hypothetical protein
LTCARGRAGFSLKISSSSTIHSPPNIERILFHVRLCTIRLSTTACPTFHRIVRTRLCNDTMRHICRAPVDSMTSCVYRPSRFSLPFQHDEPASNLVANPSATSVDLACVKVGRQCMAQQTVSVFRRKSVGKSRPCVASARSSNAQHSVLKGLRSQEMTQDEPRCRMAGRKVHGCTNL